SAVDKDTLATLQPAILEKHRPGRYGDDRHSAGFDEAKSTGLRARRDASASANSAYAPTKRSFVTPKTASPGSKSSTPSPTSTTTPERSAPSVTGKVTASPLLPSRISASQGPTPAAPTLTRTSPLRGVGTDIEERCNCSIPPNAPTWAARIFRGKGKRSALS